MAHPCRRRHWRRLGGPTSRGVPVAPPADPAPSAVWPLVLAAALIVATLAGCRQETVQLDRDPAGEPPPAGQPPAAEPRGEDAVARDLFDRLNDERNRRDLAPLEWDDRLRRLARDWSQHMAQTGKLEHRDIDQELVGEMEGFTGLGENIFGASRPVPAGRVHVGWMESPGHRANLLSPRWDRVGIAVVCPPDGGMFATQNFGRTTAHTRAVDTPGDPPPEEPIARPESDGPTCAADGP